MDKHEEVALGLLPLLGGASNISSVTNCMTRMRVDVIDPSLIQEAAIRKTPG